MIAELKAELWSRFGTAEHPAEWDGTVFGGGKLSQRYWEYFKAIELMDLSEESWVLDIGGGAAFFADLLGTQGCQVTVMDGSAKDGHVQEHASYRTLVPVLNANPGITHISCISVMEHMSPEDRFGTFMAIDEAFKGKNVVVTLEYHAKHKYFEEQLTVRSLHEAVKGMKNFYPDVIESSPVWCENAYGEDYGKEIPRWYPLAIRFVGKHA